jgi:hypothetical protein
MVDTGVAPEGRIFRRRADPGIALVVDGTDIGAMRVGEEAEPAIITNVSWVR